MLTPVHNRQVEARDIRWMEGVSRQQEAVPPGLGKVSIMSETVLSAPPEKQHSQTDSFLTAARLVRKAWTEEGKRTGRPFPLFDPSGGSISRSDGNQGPNTAEDPWVEEVSIVMYRKTVDRQGTNEDRQAAEGAFSVHRQTGVSVWTSGCRSRCRQLRRFKAPCLPVIAEK
ncbi:hypothetical protein Q5P01_019045 [Channa striata]|uniref:Uncharacterized protein n=1 Tax=Channa striata TaxID=64152 RepID=A0AA88S552_CHASR|nr:hypothetical protein Q5P01_019045 [Channa striata]